MPTGIAEWSEKANGGHAVLIVSTARARYVGGDRLCLEATTLSESVQRPVRSDGRTTVLVQLDAKSNGTRIDTARCTGVASWGFIGLQVCVYGQRGSWFAVSMANVHAVPRTAARTNP